MESIEIERLLSLFFSPKTILNALRTIWNRQKEIKMQVSCFLWLLVTPPMNDTMGGQSEVDENQISFWTIDVLWLTRD